MSFVKTRTRIAHSILLACVFTAACGEGTREVEKVKPAKGGASSGGQAGADPSAAGVATTAGANAGTTSGSAGSAGSCDAAAVLEQSFAGTGTRSCDPTTLPTSFAWQTTGPILAPISDATHNLVSIKDPTAVYFEGKWHVYATTASKTGNWNMVYLNFTDWSEAAQAPQYYMDKTPGLTGYHCAPHLFYFRPQNKWYLVYQSGPPQYSTTNDVSRPETWTPPKSFYATEPETVRINKGAGGWLDFWVICDEQSCYLFFTDDTGNYYRAKTAITDFPSGFGEPEVIIRDTKENVFEASNVYKIKGTNQYLLLIEAFGPTGQRYFRSWTAESLEGTWKPLADSWTNPFANRVNVTPAACVKKWNEDISHGELLRDGYDETMTVDLCNLKLLYQGVEVAQRNLANYSQIPWRLALALPKL